MILNFPLRYCIFNLEEMHKFLEKLCVSTHTRKSLHSEQAYILKELNKVVVCVSHWLRCLHPLLEGLDFKIWLHYQSWLPENVHSGREQSTTHIIVSLHSRQVTWIVFMILGFTLVQFQLLFNQGENQRWNIPVLQKIKYILKRSWVNI